MSRSRDRPLRPHRTAPRAHRPVATRHGDCDGGHEGAASAALRPLGARSARWMDRSALHPGPALTSHPAYCSPAHVIRGAGRCETKKKRSRPFTSTPLISGRGIQSTNTEHVTRQEGIWGGRVHSENNGMMQLAPVRRRGGRAGGTVTLRDGARPGGGRGRHAPHCALAAWGEVAGDSVGRSAGRRTASHCRDAQVWSRSAVRRG